MSLIEGYIEPSLLNSSLSLSLEHLLVAADKGRREAVADQQCEMKFTLKNELRKHSRNTQSRAEAQRIPWPTKLRLFFSFLKIATNFPPRVTLLWSRAQSNCQDWKILKSVKVSGSANAYQLFLGQNKQAMTMNAKFIPHSSPSSNFPNLTSLPKSPKSSNFPNLLNSSNPTRDS